LQQTLPVWNVPDFAFQQLNFAARVWKLRTNQPLRLQPMTKGYPMIIGNFSYNPDRDTYSGDITTLTLQRSNVLIRPTVKESDREPDYRIVHERGGAIVELGAAWKRSSERGRDFLSIVLDDPALPASLNAALFPDRDDRATLVWQRQVKKAPAAEPERTNSQARRPTAARSPRLADATLSPDFWSSGRPCPKPISPWRVLPSLARERQDRAYMS
jgi:uncharacterized protein (DUF736 family)